MATQLSVKESYDRLVEKCRKYSEHLALELKKIELTMETLPSDNGFSFKKKPLYDSLDWLGQKRALVSTLNDALNIQGDKTEKAMNEAINVMIDSLSDFKNREIIEKHRDPGLIRFIMDVLHYLNPFKGDKLNFDRSWNPTILKSEGEKFIKEIDTIKNNTPSLK